MNGLMKNTKNTRACRTSRGLSAGGRSRPISRCLPRIINQRMINRFVNRIEKKKNFKRDHNLVFRHIISEVGELDREIFEFEKKVGADFEKLWPGSVKRSQKKIAFEILDIIFLSCYMAELFRIRDINEFAMERMKDIAVKYGVKFNEKEFKKNV